MSLTDSATGIGARTIPATIDHISTHDPERLWASYPRSSTAFEQGVYENITFSELSRAIDALAWHLHAAFLRRQDLDTIAYIGPSDLRYFVLACAACKCGLKALFPSPRNDLQAHLSLLERTSCQMILRSREMADSDVLGSLICTRNLEVAEMPSIDELLTKTQPYQWEQTFDAVASRPFLVLHTSGSTGLPKPVDITHGLMATVDAQQNLPDVDGRSVSASEWANRRVYTALPPFHSAGVNFFAYSIFQGTTLVLGPSDQPPSLGSIEQTLDLNVASAGVMAPSLLEEAARDPDVLAKLERWGSIAFGGAPLSPEAGDLLWQKTKVLRILGSTETFNIPELVPDCQDEWQYHYFHPSLGINFRPQGEYVELVFVRDPALLKHQGAFWTFPDREEYPMGDLYDRHPNRTGLWKYCGRADNMIILSNGEKLNPRDTETLISQNEYVKSAIVIGNGQTQPMLLVEPSQVTSDDDATRLQRESIAATTKLANSKLPGHAQIHESHSVILDTPEAFPRSSKGEIQRAKAVEKCDSKISEVLAGAESGATGGNGTLDLTNESKLLESLSSVLSSEQFAGKRLAAESDIFQAGFDSLKTMKLLRSIKASVRTIDAQRSSMMTPKMIYQNPTPTALARSVLRLAANEDSNGANESSTPAEVQKALEPFAERIQNLSRPNSELHTVLLTGSTGSLGSYLLDRLTRNDSVRKVICLNRRENSQDQQATSNRSRGLSEDFSKVVFLQADLSQEKLGLQQNVYRNLLLETDYILHNAWPVNFNLGLSSFEPQLEGCFRLMELVQAARQSIEICFFSSIGAANQWSRWEDGPVPEKAIEDFRIAESTGYSQSKLLSEKLLSDCASKLNVPLTICRIGQIAGPVRSEKGSWNANEWFPSIMLSSKALGKIPGDLAAMDRLDWIPVDLLADIMLEAFLSEQPQQDHDSREMIRYLHLVNPQETRWNQLVSTIAPSIAHGVDIVPFKEWLEALISASESDQQQDADIPALKLIDFFQELDTGNARRPKFSTDNAQAYSKLLADLPAVSSQWVETWLQQWKSLEPEEAHSRGTDQRKIESRL